MQSLEVLEGMYLDHHRAVGSSPKTVEHYRNTFIIFHRFLQEKGLVEDTSILTTATLNAFAGFLRETPTKGQRGRTERSVVTVHGNLKDMRAFLRWLHEEELLEILPKVPIPKLPRMLFPVLTDTELSQIFQSKQLDITNTKQLMEGEALIVIPSNNLNLQKAVRRISAVLRERGHRPTVVTISSTNQTCHPV